MKKTKIPKRNEQIKVNKVKVVDGNGDFCGVMNTKEAIKMAQNESLDLVEIQPKLNPPICKIIDFGKFRYNQTKKEKQQRKKSKDLKEVRLGKTINIEKHDLNVKINQIKKFLLNGHSVLVVQNLKRRESREFGLNRLNEIAQNLNEIAKISKEPAIQRFNVAMTLSPLNQEG